VTVHLDYSLKGTTASSPNFGNPPIVYAPFQSTATIKVGGVAAGFSYSNTSLLGRGKKVTAVYGTLSDASGPLNDVWVKIAQGSNYALTQTGADGFYIFYDGQTCDGSDNLDGGCNGIVSSITTWSFANGTSNATITILGQGAAASGGPTFPGSPQWTKADVYQASTKLTNPSLSTPTFSFSVAKNSAYNRDWRFHN
jgi:hypothetical protein